MGTQYSYSWDKAWWHEIEEGTEEREQQGGVLRLDEIPRRSKGEKRKEREREAAVEQQWSSSGRGRETGGSQRLVAVAE